MDKKIVIKKLLESNNKLLAINNFRILTENNSFIPDNKSEADFKQSLEWSEEQIKYLSALVSCLKSYLPENEFNEIKNHLDKVFNNKIENENNNVVFVNFKRAR